MAYLWTKTYLPELWVPYCAPYRRIGAKAYHPQHICTEICYCGRVLRVGTPNIRKQWDAVFR